MIEDCSSIPDSQCDCLGAKDHDHHAVRFGTPALTNPESQDDLCSTCQTLNLAAIRRVSCPNCFPDQIGLFGSSDPLRSNDRDLGPVRRILDNEGCPACRLVASCILSSGYQITPESAVTLHVMSMHKYPTGTIGLTSTISLTSACIEVLIQELDTRATIVGKIVPVGPEVDAKLQSESVFCTSETDLSIMGRLVPSTINVRLLRQWMKHCETSHPACRQTTPISPAFNKKIRLIDVKERRIVDGTLDARYVALSYVWGSQTSPILTKSTLEHLIAPNSLTNEKLSQTIVDAIELVADLGERYLWVDSACVIQDEPIDKQLQLPIMDRIYSGAALVVVAAAGDNADAGLPGRGKRSRTFDQRVETIQSVQLVNIHPDLVYLLRDTVWYSRGWTFQETLLSRRALIFTEHQVYWSCRCDTWCEDQYTPHGDLVTPLNWYSSLFGPRKTSSCGWIRENFVPCETQQYCARVVEYSFRSLKDQGDALWAFVGILKSMRDDFDKDFIWGMPYQILDHALLWRPNCPWHFHRRSATHSAVKLGGQAVEPMRFPSFSWLSVYCGVYYPDTCDDDLVSEVEWHEPMYYDGIERCLRVFDCGHTLVLPPEEAIHNYHDKTSEPGLDEHGTDFGLLQFTAETATLVLRISPETETTIQKDSQLVQANIHAPSGEVIGTIWAERDKFSHERESEGEFVLLSSYQLDPDDPGYNHRHPGKTTDMVPCKHVAELNIMLINWNRELAYRVSWTRITRDAWSKLSVTKKKIVLA